MAQPVRCLSGKQEDQSLDPQNTYEKLNLAACACDPCLEN